jgi:hypothetical protein
LPTKQNPVYSLMTQEPHSLVLCSVFLSNRVPLPSPISSPEWSLLFQLQGNLLTHPARHMVPCRRRPVLLYIQYCHRLGKVV